MLPLKMPRYELGDDVLFAFMSQYGEVVPDSIRRGKIHGTSIENGTRYLNIIGCVPTLPLRSTIGRFNIRIFGNNDRTPCFRCNEKGHPSYRCPKKGLKACFVCKETDHFAKECPKREWEVCYFCREPGHIQRNCPSRDVEVYGDYAEEVREGKEEDVTQEGNDTKVDTNKPSEIDTNTNKPLTVILGASNARRMNIDDKNIINASISGATLYNVRQTIDKAKSELRDETPSKVVVSLGTNDVSQNKLDAEQVILNLTSAVMEVKDEFPGG